MDFWEKLLNAAKTALKMDIASIRAAPLAKGNTVAEDVTCTDADTDYPMASAMAAGTKYLVVYCDTKVKVAMGAAVSATNGEWVPAGQSVYFSVVPTGVAADDKAHVMAADAGAVVTFTSKTD
jgi:hypothetical protein